jgi:hypothetical protein
MYYLYELIIKYYDIIIIRDVLIFMNFVDIN